MEEERIEAAIGQPEAEEDGKKAWYQDVTMKEAEEFIQANLKSAARSVIAVGYYLKCIRDNGYYLEAGYESIWEYAQGRYGFSKSTASRYMSRNDRFSVGGNSPVLDARYREFSKAQLQEMLSLDEEQLEQVRPEMTARQIRELRTPREILCIEIPGQISIEDFPEFLPEMEGPGVMTEADSPERTECRMTIGELFVESGGVEGFKPQMREDVTSVAMPQQELSGIGGETMYEREYFEFQETDDDVQTDTFLKTNKWVPVEENLPKENIEVLVTVEYDQEDGEINSFSSTDVYRGGEWQEWNGVVAWMPMPEPYRPEIMREGLREAGEYADAPTLRSAT